MTHSFNDRSGFYSSYCQNQSWAAGKVDFNGETIAGGVKRPQGRTGLSSESDMTWTSGLGEQDERAVDRTAGPEGLLQVRRFGGGGFREGPFPCPAFAICLSSRTSQGPGAAGDGGPGRRSWTNVWSSQVGRRFVQIG